MRTRCAWLHVREGAQHECYVHIWSCQGKAEHGELMKQFSQLVVPLLRELFHYCFHYRENCSITERIFITEIIVPLLRELFQCWKNCSIAERTCSIAERICSIADCSIADRTVPSIAERTVPSIAKRARGSTRISHGWTALHCMVHPQLPAHGGSRHSIPLIVWVCMGCGQEIKCPRTQLSGPPYRLLILWWPVRWSDHRHTHARLPSTTDWCIPPPPFPLQKPQVVHECCGPSFTHCFSWEGLSAFW